MSTKLVNRIQDIPGVAAVSLDLEDPEAGGINVRLEPDADEMEVLERVRGLLVAYGVRSQGYPTLRVGRTRMTGDRRLGVDVRITPIKGGARVLQLRDRVGEKGQMLAVATKLREMWS